jgi:hypothetical protein
MDVLDRLFDKLWPDLEEKLLGIPVPVSEKNVKAKRDPDEMIAEIST